MSLIEIGALCFGLVIGWVTYRTLMFRPDSPGLSDIATIIGAVGGAAVTGLFETQNLFAAYSIGLAIGFFLFLIVANVFPNSRLSS
jgi:hypothetical protein